MQSPNSSSVLIDVLYPASQLDEGVMYVFPSLILPPAVSSMAWTSRCLSGVLRLSS